MSFFEVTHIASLVAVGMTLIVAVVTLFKRDTKRKKAMMIYRRVALLCAVIVSIGPLAWVTELLVAYHGGNIFEVSASTNRAVEFSSYLIACGIPALFWLPVLRKFPPAFILLLSLWLVFNWPK